MSTSVPLLDNSIIACLNLTVALAVGIPCAVIAANAAETSSNDTPAPTAVGMTLYKLLDNSPNVVFPSFTVWNIKSLALATDKFSSPYAFVTDVRPSTAVSRFDTPPTAALLAISINGIASSFETPAEMA